MADLVLPGTVDELYRRLLTLPRWRELPEGRSSVGPDAVYLQRRSDGFVALSRGPGDPGYLMPPWVRVTAIPDARGIRLRIRRVPSANAIASVGVTAGLTVVLPLIMLVLAVDGATIGAGLVAGYLALVGVLWAVLGRAWRAAWRRSNHAWSELSRAVTRLALAESEDETGPYRE